MWHTKIIIFVEKFNGRSAMASQGMREIGPHQVTPMLRDDTRMWSCVFFLSQIVAMSKNCHYKNVVKNVLSFKINNNKFQKKALMSKKVIGLSFQNLLKFVGCHHKLPHWVTATLVTPLAPTLVKPLAPTSVPPLAPTLVTPLVQWFYLRLQDFVNRCSNTGHPFLNYINNYTKDQFIYSLHSWARWLLG